MMNVRRVSAFSSLASVIIAACALASPAVAQDKPADMISLTVSLGDVSVTKLPFIMAADHGI
jgi:hypothetical protein